MANIGTHPRTDSVRFVLGVIERQVDLVRSLSSRSLFLTRGARNLSDDIDEELVQIVLATHSVIS